MITLYHRADCPFCWKVRIALHELDVPYKEIEIKLGEKHPDVLALSPKGTVPVMVDGNLVIWESSIILEYLEDDHHAKRLLPDAAGERALVRSLHYYSDAIVGPAIRDLIFEKRSKPKKSWGAAVIADSDKRWRRRLTELEAKLNEDDRFAAAFSFADCALLPRFGLADHYGAGVDKRHPGLLAWYQTMRRRPSFRATEPPRPEFR